jgi:LmbE family N-acetylglucosaminyl deacetylase
MNRIFEEGKPGRVLGFGAHPDDLEVGAGGLLARLANEGAEVTMAVISVPNRLEERLAEAERGARTLGARLLVLFADRPCRVEDIAMYDLVARLDTVVGDFRPDLVVTHSEHDLHWDHGLVNRATVSALRRAPCDLLAYLSSPENNAQTRGIGQCFADISGFMEQKIDAISCHRSQMARLDAESSRDLARAMGRIGGFSYAEGYEVLRVRI